MSGVLAVQWTVIPKTPPQPLIGCNGCGGTMPFRSSGKFRLNARGKRLDAWLIYRCANCESTWNRPIFQRQDIGEIDPAMMQALQSNDEDWARSLAFDVEQLRRYAPRFREFSDACVRRQILLEEMRPWSKLTILLKVPLRTSTRTDRLLASELKISRSRIQNFAKSGRLDTGYHVGRELRRPAKDQMQITISLSELGDAQEIAVAAAGVTFW